MYEYRFVAESEAESLSREVNVAVREGWDFVKIDVSVSAVAGDKGGARATLLVATLQRQVRTGSTMHPEFDPEESVRPGAPDNFSGGSDSLPDLLSR